MANYTYSTYQFFDEVLAYSCISSYVGQPNTNDMQDIAATMVDCYNTLIKSFASRMAVITVSGIPFAPVLSPSVGLSCYKALHKIDLDWADMDTGSIIPYSMSLPIYKITCISGNSGVFNGLSNFPSVVQKGLENSGSGTNVNALNGFNISDRSNKYYFLSLPDSILYTTNSSIACIRYALPLPPVVSYTNANATTIQYNPFTLPYLGTTDFTKTGSASDSNISDPTFCKFLQLAVANDFCNKKGYPLRGGAREEYAKLYPVISGRHDGGELIVTNVSDATNR